MSSDVRYPRLAPDRPQASVVPLRGSDHPPMTIGVEGRPLLGAEQEASISSKPVTFFHGRPFVVREPAVIVARADY